MLRAACSAPTQVIAELKRSAKYMKTTIINWLLIITLTAAGYFGGRIFVSQYFKSKYPDAYHFEVNGGGIDTAALERYKAEKNTIMLGLLISSSIIASSAVIASAKK